MARSAALVLILALALGFCRSARAQDFESTWEELSGTGKGSGGGGGPVVTPPPAPFPGASDGVSAAPAPKKAPTPKPIPKLDPKTYPKINDYACDKLKLEADLTSDAIEARRGSANKDPLDRSALENVYEDAYKKAYDAAKKASPKPSDKKADEIARKAARDAIRNEFSNGNSVNPATGETWADFYRREWESAKRGTPPGPVPPPSTARPAKMSPYMTECADAGVPLPPPWGDPRWVYQGELPESSNFAGGDKKFTEVYTSKTPNGICYALPRRKSQKSDPIELLGQICQNQATGKACFWDNVPAGGGPRVEGPALEGRDPSTLQGADELEENCTKCHRGDNVFIVHVATPLDLGPTDPCGADTAEQKIKPTNPAKRYEPIGRKIARPIKAGGDPEDAVPFANGPSITLPSGPGKGCTKCHAMPALTKNYCGLVNGFVGTGEMPPDGEVTADMQKDIDKLKQECAKL